MKIVLDTNVLVSAFLSARGAPAQILGLILEGYITLCVEPRIVHEYKEVLTRPQWHFTEEDISDVLEVLLDNAITINAPLLNIELPDPDDLVFVETAAATRADAIVTGNRHHFPKKTTGKIPVLSPSEFLEAVRKKIHPGD